MQIRPTNEHNTVLDNLTFILLLKLNVYLFIITSTEFSHGEPID